MHATLPLLFPGDFPRVFRGKLETLQVNLGYLCNQQCQHCHVNAGPNRKEQMQTETIEQVLGLLKNSAIKQLDLTGGAPEMNPFFRYLVKEATALGVHVIDRCNLTILEESGQEDLVDFLAQHGVEITASLPCYLEENVDAQRGKKVYEKSIAALKKLNKKGYGKESTGLILNLVYNPTGPYLPPAQNSLEMVYRRELRDRFNLEFTRLLTLTNLPIKRFGSTLISRGEFNDYLSLLKDAHSNDNLGSVMCRSLISIDWQGFIYDCDFNQMLELPLGSSKPTHISQVNIQALTGQAVQVADHCYGCTAGQGSSCGGALVSAPEKTPAK